MIASHRPHGTLPPSPAQPFSPLVLADRLLSLAQDADRAGLTATADRLVKLACAVWDRPAH